MEQPPPSASRPLQASRQPGSAPAWPALAGFFDGDSDTDALERMLLAFAVHPHGSGGARAYVVLWNARTGLLEGCREAAAAAEPGELVDAVTRARRAAEGPRTSDRVHAWAETPERLEGALAGAWRGQGLACGEGAEMPGAPWASAARIGAIALRRGARAYGALVCEWTDATAEAKGCEGLEWLRQTADAAFGAQARAAEAKRRIRHAASLAEMSRASIGAINLAEAMHLLARLAAHGVGVRGAVVYRHDAAGELRVDVAHGPPVLRDSCAQGFLAAAREAVEHRQPRAAARGEEAPGFPAALAAETSVWAALPLVAYGRVLGALVVHDGLERHASMPELERGDLEYLSTLGDFTALLIEHSRQVDDARRGERLREDQAVRLRELDHMAAVGELAARVAQESRNSIASILAFAKRAHRAVADDDPQHEYLEIVMREAERLEAMLQEQLQYAQLDRPRLKMQSLNAVVQEALQRSSETLVRRRVRLLKHLSPDLPMLLLDADRIRRVVENVVAFALESVPIGGRIKLDSRRASGFVVVEIAHDGSRAGGDLMEQLFVPFSTGAAGGAAVGLGVAQQIVREHGGEVRVRGEGEWGTVFAFTLPISGNEERRKADERRSVRGERRRRAPREGS